MSKLTEIFVVGAAILRGNECLIAQRSQTMASPGKWEFPGGKVESEELPQQALAREIEEELNLVIDVSEFLGRSSLMLREKTIHLDIYAAKIISGSLTLREHAKAKWVSEEELHHHDWAAADIPILPKVAAYMRRQAF